MEMHSRRTGGFSAFIACICSERNPGVRCENLCEGYFSSPRRNSPPIHSQFGSCPKSNSNRECEAWNLRLATLKSSREPRDRGKRLSHQRQYRGAIGFSVSTTDSTFKLEIFSNRLVQWRRSPALDDGEHVAGVHRATPVPDPVTGLLFENSVTTYEAYNFWPGGANGKELYDFAPGGRAWKVSFNRPYVLGMSYSSTTTGAATGVGAGEYLANLQPGPAQGVQIPPAGFEYNMVRWLEKNGYDVTYCTEIDVHENINLPDHSAYLYVGHNEYWSMQML